MSPCGGGEVNDSDVQAEAMFGLQMSGSVVLYHSWQGYHGSLSTISFF